jgi:hypothetical protein
VSRRKARYRAKIHKSDIAAYLRSGWDLDGETMPSGGMVTIVWLKDDRPADMPETAEMMGGLWQ